MFRSIYLKTLRGYRIAIFGWGVGMGLILVELIAGTSTLASSAQARATLESMASSFAWNAEAIKADTPGGYATWKLGIFIFLICVWPLLAASRTLRGEEDRGTLDVLLSMPRTRLRIALEKVAAIWTALLAMAVLMAVMAYATGAKFNADFTLADAFLFGLNVALICMVIAGVAMLISQFTQERGPAAGATGAVLVVFIVVDMVHRVIPNTDGFSHLSPIYYYNLSKPLIPSVGTSAGGMLVQLGLAAILTGASIWLFALRDVGATVPLPGWLSRPARPATRQAPLPESEWSLRTIYLRGLRMAVVPTLWWASGLAGGAAWMVTIVVQMQSQLKSLAAGSPALAAALKTLGGGGASLNANLLSAIFGLFPLLMMAFAVTQVNSWSADESEGRLEMILGTPRSRRLVILGRFAALTTAIVFIGLVTLAATSIAASAAGLALDQRDLAAASIGLIPMGLLVAAIGYLAGGWLGTAADTGLLSFLLAAWFFITFIGPELKWPDNALKLSAFYYYGTPLLHGLQTDMLVVVAGIAVALAAGTLRFSRKDIGV